MTISSQHSFVLADVQEGEHRIVETADVEQNHRFRVKLQGLPREYLKKLFKGAETAGQSEECICLFAHKPLACVHCVHDMQFAEAVVADFLVNQHVRNDAHDAAACCECGVGDGTHESDLCASIDEADAAAGQCAAEVLRSLAVQRACAI